MLNGGESARSLTPGASSSMARSTPLRTVKEPKAKPAEAITIVSEEELIADDDGAEPDAAPAADAAETGLEVLQPVSKKGKQRAAVAADGSAKPASKDKRPAADGDLKSTKAHVKASSKQAASSSKLVSAAVRNDDDDEADSNGGDVVVEGAQPNGQKVGKMNTLASRTEARLREDARLAHEEAVRCQKQAEKYRVKWEKAIAMVNQAPKPEELLEQIATLEDRLQSQDKTMEELKAAITASHRLTDHMAPVLHFQTREHAMHERKALEDENHRLNTLLEQQAKAHEESLSNAKSGDEGVRKRIAELEEDVAMAQRQLKAEVDRSQQLASKPSSSAKTLPNGILGDHNINALKLYEDLTNLMITGCKSEIDPDTGHSQLVYQCICTGAQSGVGESKAVSFALRVFYQPPEASAPAPDKIEHNQCKYIPRGLEQEDADFLAHLEFLTDPFTFAKDQLDVFFKTLTERLKMPPAVDDDEDDEDGVNTTVADDTMAVDVDHGGDPHQPITIDD